MTEDMTLAEEARRLAADCRREAELVWTGAWHLPGNEYMNEHAQRLTHVANVLEMLARDRDEQNRLRAYYHPPRYLDLGLKVSPEFRDLEERMRVSAEFWDLGERMRAALQRVYR